MSEFDDARKKIQAALAAEKAEKDRKAAEELARIEKQKREQEAERAEGIRIDANFEKIKMPVETLLNTANSECLDNSGIVIPWQKRVINSYLYTETDYDSPGQYSRYGDIPSQVVGLKVPKKGDIVIYQPYRKPDNKFEGYVSPNFLYLGRVSQVFQNRSIQVEKPEEKISLDQEVLYIMRQLEEKLLGQLVGLFSPKT